METKQITCVTYLISHAPYWYFAGLPGVVGGKQMIMTVDNLCNSTNDVPVGPRSRKRGRERNCRLCGPNGLITLQI